MQYDYKQEQDRVFSMDEFRQFDQLNENMNSRIPIFFCVDISGSMGSPVGIFETRLSLLSKVMKRLLERMKRHHILSERAVVGIVTYNDKAVLQQPALDLGVLDIERAVRFNNENQTIFSLGLRRTLQAIDHYRDSIRRSDMDTFTPILVFMTDGEPVGDDNDEIREVYSEIWRRIQKGDLYVFPIGISRQAKMNYVSALVPDHHSYQMVTEKDFEQVFANIEEIVNTKSGMSFEEDTVQTQKASTQAETSDTGSGTAFDPSEFFSAVIAKH